MGDALHKILSEDYLGDLSAAELTDLRARRAECKDVETGLSYLRRLVQGRLDVIDAERQRLAQGGAPDDLDELVSRLPDVLAEKTRSPGTGRLPSDFGTGAPDDDLVAEFDELVAAHRVSGESDLGEADLAAAAEALADFERRVSGLRLALFGRIDAIEDELTRRYRTGEASVDSLLGGS